jgi:CRP/FNR family cyclic AMP-dependent transcriptional regulator
LPNSIRDLLGDPVWTRLCALAPRRYWPARTVLLRQGDPGTHVLAVEAGSTILTRDGPNGERLLLAVRGPGELYGEMAVLDQGTRSCTVSAAAPCTVRVILAADFRRFVDSHGLSDPLLRHTIQRLREAEDIRFELATAPVPARLAFALVRLADADGRPGDVPIPLTQGELARLIGASRNAVGHTLALWRANNWLTTTGGLVLTDVAALKRSVTGVT